MLVEQWIGASLFGVLGLLIGSFLNVVIYRVPKMMERQWAGQMREVQRSDKFALPNCGVNHGGAVCLLRMDMGLVAHCCGLEWLQRLRVGFRDY